MLTLIGKKYSKETNTLKTFLEKHSVDFSYVDLEMDKEVAEYYLKWMKANKITGLPILKKGKYFTCGCNQKRIETFLKENL